jgi:hypothetical protein
MKIAYKEKDCVDGNADWESCTGCIFEQLADKRIWPCDFIPYPKCYGTTIFVHSNNLSDVFQV